MKDFNLETALAEWRKRVVAKSKPEMEDLAELESGLLDRYDEGLIKGLSPRLAFANASKRVSSVDIDEPVTRSRDSGFGWSLLANYFKVAGRNLRARRWYNLTNFFSLAIGIITAALALLYLSYENNYDAHLPEVDRKYRVGIKLRAQGYSLISFPNYNGTEPAVQQRQIAEFSAIPGVAQAVQFANFPGPTLAEANGRKLPLEEILKTNTAFEFVDFFGISFLTGDVESFQSAPNTVLLTESVARRFFGEDWRDQTVRGERLRIDTIDYAVSGIIKDPVSRMHFTYSILINQPKVDYWGARTYIKLNAGTDPKSIKNKINNAFGSINNTLATNELFGGVLLQPLRSIHLESDLLYELKPPGDVRYLYIIALIALVILLLTISNYTNLSIVMNAGRAREIGMRKVFGASDGQVAGQFLLEAVLLSLFTLPFVLLGLWYLIPRFNLLMCVELSRDLFSDYRLPISLFGLTLLIGLLAGGYPAFYLARTRVQTLFKGKVVGAAGGKLTTRKVIVTLQFALLIGLCSLTLFVNRQLSYIQNKDLGYRKENILYVNLNADSTLFATFRNEVLRLPGVTGVGSGTPMGLTPFNQTTYKLKGTEQVFDDAVNIYLDYRAIAQMDIETSVPNYINDPDAAPTALILINQTLADRLKNRFDLTDTELVGQTILQEPEYVDEESGAVGFPYIIGGTFADLHLFSLRESIDPMFLTVYRDPRYVYTASISYDKIARPDLLTSVEQAYEQLNLNRQFTPTFLTDNLDELYQGETRIATLSNYFSALAIIMAIIGLVALTSYLTTLKRKEIGIRKILGASNLDILRRFNLEYVPLLLIAALITIPVSWWGISRWLEGFAYRISVDVWVFLAAILLVALISGLAVSLVALRAAGAVPAQVLGHSE